MVAVFPGVRLLPATAPMLAAFFAFQSETCTASTLRTYYYGIGAAHQDELLSFPALKECTEAYQTLQGIKRKRKDAVKRAHALSVDDLVCVSAMVEHRKQSGSLSARDIANDQAVLAAMLLAFLGLFRKSTVCGAQGLRRKDLEFVRKDGKVILWVTVTSSKTIQFGERCLRIPIPEMRGDLCAVSAVLEHMIAMPADGDASVFLWTPPGGKPTPMSHSSFVTRMRLLLDSAGLEPGKYTGHSLRRGGATLAFESGDGAAWDRRIMQHGDWSSDVVFQYHQISDETRLQLPSRMAAAMARP